MPHIANRNQPRYNFRSIVLMDGWFNGTRLLAARQMALHRQRHFYSTPCNPHGALRNPKRRNNTL